MMSPFFRAYFCVFLRRPWRRREQAPLKRS